MLDPLAGGVDHPVQVDAERVHTVDGRGGQEQLLEGGHHVQRHPPDTGTDRVGGHLPPAEQGQPLVLDDVGDDLLGLGADRRVGGQESGADRVGLAVPRIGALRQLEVDDRSEQRVRDLDQDARAVTDRGVGTGGAAVVQVDQRRDAVVDDRVAAAALDVGHGGDTTGVTFELWVVQPLGGGCCRVLHGRPPVVGGAAASRRFGTVDMSRLRR